MEDGDQECGRHVMQTRARMLPLFAWVALMDIVRPNTAGALAIALLVPAITAIGLQLYFEQNP